MVLENAKKLLDERKFEEAKNQIKNFLLIENEYNQEIFQLLKDFEERQELDQLVYDYLWRIGRKEELFQILEDKDLHIKESILFLKCLRDFGRYQQFSIELKKVLERVLSNKYFSRYETIVKEFQEDLASKNYFIIFNLLYAIEINDREAVEKYVQVICDKLLSSPETYKKLFTQMKDIVLELNTLDKTLYGVQLKVSLLSKLLAGEKIIESVDLIEFILLNDRIEDYCLLNEFVEDEEISRIVYQKLKIKRLRSSQVSAVFKKTKKYFSAQVQVLASSIEENKENFTIGNEEILVNETSSETNSEYIVESYTRDEDEEKLLKYLKFDDSEDIHSLVIAFIEMRFFDAAETLLLKVNETSNALYLRALIKIEKGDAISAIDFANEALVKYSTQIDDHVPFEYIKYQAYKILNESKQAQVIKDRILLIDPDFRDIKNE